MNAYSIDQISHIFTEALEDVISVTTGFTLTISPAEDISDFDTMTGFMSLNGKNHGLVFISADEPAMKVICSYMTGIQPKDISKDDIEDALCELVNMTAGNAKLRFSDMEQRYSLSSPFLIRGKEMSITGKNRIKIISRVLSNEEISIKLKVVFY